MGGGWCAVDEAINKMYIYIYTPRTLLPQWDTFVIHSARRARTRRNTHYIRELFSRDCARDVHNKLHEKKRRKFKSHTRLAQIIIKINESTKCVK